MKPKRRTSTLKSQAVNCPYVTADGGRGAHWIEECRLNSDNHSEPPRLWGMLF